MPSPPANLTTGTLGSNDSEEVPRQYQDKWSEDNTEPDGSDAASEVEEELSSRSGSGSGNGNGYGVYKLSTIRDEVGTVFSYDFDGGEDAVYVAVGKGREAETSMDALIWTVNNAVVDRSSTVVFLVHVFPQTKFIPSPLGMLPVSQVNPQQQELYMSQQRAKRREFLQKFLRVCSSSQVKVDTILVESDSEAKAILDLIPLLHIRKLVLGATKSTVRKIKSKKGNTVADQILQNAPEFCDVKIICEGKEMSELAWESFSPSPSPSPSSLSRASNLSFLSRSSNLSSKFDQQEKQLTTESVASCSCFKRL